MDGNDKELEIRVKKIIIHKKIHALLQELKKDANQSKEEPQPVVIPDASSEPWSLQYPQLFENR